MIGATEGPSTGRLALLPDPEPRAIRVPIISVDDHLIEPPDLFDGRVPARMAERAPRIVEDGDGFQYWLYEGRRYPNIGLNAVIGRPKEAWSMEPARFEDMRPGCFDIDARIVDMDLNGVWASLCFPSLVAGFCGAVFTGSDDPELGLACLRAWNQWHLEVWAGTFPERIIPLQLPWLADVEVAAAEVRVNAERGFKAVSFPSSPPSSNSLHLHRSLGSVLRRLRGDRHGGLPAYRCLVLGAIAVAVTTLRAPPHLVPGQRADCRGRVAVVGCPASLPRLSVAMSEGGIGWVPMLLDRVDYVLSHSGSGDESISWPSDLRPSEVLKRNFWFCTIDDPSLVDLRHVIGVDHIMVESDYPTPTRPGRTPRRCCRRRWAGSTDRAAHGGGRQRRTPVPPSPARSRRLAGPGTHHGAGRPRSLSSALRAGAGRPGKCGLFSGNFWRGVDLALSHSTHK